MSNPQHISVLILGINPAAQALAYLLAKQKIPLRIFSTPSEIPSSDQVLLHARSFELLRLADIAEAFEKIGQPIKRSLFFKSDGTETKEFGRSIHAVLESRYPYGRISPIDEITQTFSDLLQQIGITPEQNITLQDIQKTPDRINCRFKKDNIEEKLSCDYLIDCTVLQRDAPAKLHVLDTLQKEKKYLQTARLTLTQDSPRLDLDEALLLFTKNHQLAFYPQHEKEYYCISQHDSEDKAAAFTQENLQKTLDQLTQAHATPKLHLATISHHKSYIHENFLAEKFHSERIFLLGPAAHATPTPLLPDDINSDLGDAFNLAWKLTTTIQTKAPLSFLESYNTERLHSYQQKLVTLRHLSPNATPSDWFFNHSHNALAGFEQSYPLDELFAFEKPKQKPSHQIAGKRLPDLDLTQSDGSPCRLLDFIHSDHFTLFLFVNSIDTADPHALPHAKEFADSLRQSFGKSLRIHYVLSAKTSRLLHENGSEKNSADNFLIDRIGLTSDALALLKGGACLVRPDGIIALLYR
ncbi:MAG: FAD-dependent monooxygenase, partial [Chthoniobacterales bacterium]